MVTRICDIADLIGWTCITHADTGCRFLIQILPAAVVAPLYFSGKIGFGVVNQSSSAFNHILTDISLVVYQVNPFIMAVDSLMRISCQNSI